MSNEGCPEGIFRDLVCSSECRFEAGDCRTGCDRPPRPSRTGADPICIPAGPFILGSAEIRNAQPVRTITLSEYYIDATMVTVGRYDACVEAGVCTYESSDDFWDGQPRDALMEPLGRAEWLFTFCEWDGGSLPTEFQWEKAARGPYPSTRRHSWGDDDDGPLCSRHEAFSPGVCPFPPTPESFPDAISPYGVRQMGSLAELTSSRLGSYEDLEETDPIGPLDDTLPLVRRGFEYHDDDGVPLTPSASVRMRGVIPFNFRCVY